MVLSKSPETQIDSLAVIGAGYVGLVAGACFSSFGYDVSVVEINAAKLASLSKGEVPIYEPGLTGIVDESLAQGRLNFYSSTAQLFAKKTPSIVFLAVGTPENPDGSCNLDYVFQAVRDVVGAAKNDIVLVIKSTVPVGTAARVKNLVTELSPKVRVAVVNNPEFLKEGSAVADFMRPERVVLGGSEAWALEKVKSLYEPLLHNGHPLFVTGHETAELGKLSANLMLASRVSVINQISRLSASFGADIRQVETILRSDSRIGSKYLYAGLGYGGSCFPKDIRDFIHLCKERGVDSSLAEAIDNFNDTQKLVFVEDIRLRFPDASKTVISLLGVAFKPETDDIRESPALALTAELSCLGYKIQAYDPKALHAFKGYLASLPKAQAEKVSLHETAEEALRGSQVLIVATEWQEFQRLGFGALRRLFSGRVVYDGKNIFKSSQVREWGFDYRGVGRA